MGVETLSNNDLAAANNGMTGFGTVNQSNSAYQPLLNQGLIDAAGMPVDKETLLTALKREINKRINDGSWATI